MKGLSSSAHYEAAVLAIYRLLGGAEALQKRFHSFHWYESRRTGRLLHQILALYTPSSSTGLPDCYRCSVPSS